ncbi:hypothetical protein B0T16DRAFT_420936 [Cercophora newfieldiana]|uniref:F-box domain-containing protein n=1 Tax=Cercophora newfieldiana TaxID=92897 RepID=A0AA39XZ85_9PEZI|nr:hypothetical protein B0T16DRAFT_420936 [Cercophora newfieldiana]
MNAHRDPLCLSVADLPGDILREIFDHFADESYRDRRFGARHNSQPDTENDEFKTLQALRLVCRSFYEVASPFLTPVVRVRINPESLDRVDQLTKNPLIAASVRIVQISVAYRPKELAENPSAYRDLHMRTVRSLERSCEWHTEFLDEIPEDELEGDEDQVLEAVQTYATMAQAWRHWPDKGPSSSIEGAADSEKDSYRDLLSQSFEEYRRLQQEQEQLLTSGTFVATLAASIARLPSLRAIYFLDEADVSPDDFDGRDTLTVLANDRDRVRQLLTAPHTWTVLDSKSIDPEPDILPVKLLWQLPMAIHSHGTPIPAFSIARIPILGNFSHLCPSDNAWSSLASAFSATESVHVSAGNRGVIRHEHMPQESQTHLSSYISALLSSPSIQTIHIDLYGLTLNTGSRRRTRKISERFNPIGSVFTGHRFPNLKELVLSEATFTQEELEHLFDALGTKLQRIYIYSIGVSNGGQWARALDILRERVMASPKGCTVSFSSMCGGGFEKVRPEEKEDLDEWWAIPQESPENERERNTLQGASKYVLGEKEVNPLAELEM